MYLNICYFAISDYYYYCYYTVYICYVPKRIFLASPPPVGFRIGKGEGYADMEYGMMASMGAVDESTQVVTVVHDCQVSFFL